MRCKLTSREWNDLFLFIEWSERASLFHLSVISLFGGMRVLCWWVHTYRRTKLKCLKNGGMSTTAVGITWYRRGIFLFLIPSCLRFIVAGAFRRGRCIPYEMAAYPWHTNYSIHLLLLLLYCCFYNCYFCYYCFSTITVLLLLLRLLLLVPPLRFRYCYHYYQIIIAK